MENQQSDTIKRLLFSYECALSIGNSLDLSTMLHEVIHTIVHKTNAHRGTIWVLDIQEDIDIKLGARAGLKLHEEAVLEQTITYKTIFLDLIKKRVPLIKKMGDKDFKKYCVRLTGKEQVVLLVPVEDVAVIQLVYASHDVVDETLGNIILNLSQKLHMSINACLVYKDAQRAELVQTTLYNIASAVNTTKNLNDLFLSIRDYLGKIVDTTNFYVALYNKEDKTISLPFLVDEKDQRTIFPGGKTLTSYVVQTGESLLIDIYQIDNLVKKGLIERKGPSAKIWLGVPLKIGNEILGVVVVQSYTDISKYSQKDMELLEFVSDEIAMAIKHKRAEENFAAEKERLTVTLRSVGDGVITTDVKGRVIFLNQRAEELTGWTHEDALLKPLKKVFYTVDARGKKNIQDYIKKVVAEDGIIEGEGETVLRTKDGIKRIIQESIAPIKGPGGKIIGLVLVFRDITSKLKEEEEFLKASKLESIGILAGGIAHDFNNILTAVMGNISLARTFHPDKKKTIEILTKAEKAAAHARDLTQQLLTFARGGTPIIQITSIVELVKESANFILRGSNVSCTFSFPDDLWYVKIDSGQIGQVIHNLIINACQAMPGGGKISLSAENVLVKKGESAYLKAGKYIKMDLKDRGSGISAEYMKRIFDPYFTTKPGGSGLGLAISYNIVKKHHGHISVESESGSGTTFSIYLPATKMKKVQPKKDTIKIPKGSGRVLLMDDDVSVRETAELMLNHLGYTVEGSCDGKETIQYYQKAIEAGQPFTHVILDLTVPGGMGGVETLNRLLAIDPLVKAVVSSGYSNDPIMANYKEYGFIAVIPKPYDIRTLGEVMAKI